MKSIDSRIQRVAIRKLQNRYDLEIERDNIGGALDRIEPLRTA